jgi:zinc transport system substrate-binding protein
MIRAFLRHILVVLASVAALLLPAGCAPDAVQCNYKATVTIEPLRYFFTRLAGPQWQVSTVVPKGFSPEEFMPTASQMARVAESCCLFKVGRLGFETTALADVLGSGIYVCDTSEGLPARQTDPHTWTSPANARIICRNMAAALSRLDTANASHYAERLRQVEASIDSLDRELKALTRDLPSRSFVIAHPALTQFAADYGLRQIAIESGGKEPTPGSLRQLISQARKDGVRVVFVQREFTENAALVIAQETGARIVSVNPLDYDWPAQLRLVARSLKNTTK